MPKIYLGSLLLVIKTGFWLQASFRQEAFLNSLRCREWQVRQIQKKKTAKLATLQ